TDGLGARDRTIEENTDAIDLIGITPNPYKGASSYEVSQLVDQVRFTNMPNQATIRIFTVAGTLIRTLEKNSASASFPWDLVTEEGLPVASGMYIIHIDTEFGEKVLKFGVVKKRVQLNTF
ncbi:MAG: T9SS type A sorting domain-containing protein, partial [Bacteroidetes bacterium]|nr:T9SS type A sorting domain-containing protein [Bacteroidota bacterium]